MDTVFQAHGLRRGTAFAAPFLAYLGITLLVTWPLALTFGSTFIGHSFSDAYEYIRHIWWIKHALQTGQPLFFQPLLGYPDGLSGLWLWANPLQSFPAWLFAFVLPLPAAFNLSVLLRLALNGWAMQFLVYDLTRKRAAAWLAGLIFMLYPTFQGQLAIGHSGLLLLWPVPLYIYALRHLRATPSRSWLLLSAGLFVVSLWGNILLLIYLVAPLTLFFAIDYLLRRDYRALRHLIVALLLGGIVSMLFIGPFLWEELQKPPRLSEGGDVTYSTDLLGLVTPSPRHPLFGQLDFTGRILGIDPFEREAYVGLIAFGLLLLGLWRRPAARPWLALALVAWIASLGPLLKLMNTVVTLNLNDRVSYVTLPWLAFQDLPLLNTTRTPARFNFSIALAVAIMAGYGAAVLWDGLKRVRWPLFLGLVVLVVFEYQTFWPMLTNPGTVPQPIQALAQRDDIRAVMNLPWEHLLAQKDGMFLQTGHQKPLIAGHVTRRTPVDPAKLTVLESTLDPALLDRESVDVLILHKEWARAGDRERLLQLAQPFYEDERIMAVNVPDPTSAPQFRAVYDVDQSIEDRSDAYFFAPQPGWFDLSGVVQSGGRDFQLALNGELIRQTASDGPLRMPLFVTQPGYYTLDFAVQPPCPAHYIAVLACRAVDFDGLALGDFQPETFAAPVQFAQGLNLDTYAIQTEGDHITVDLAWHFELARQENDIRFVHVVDQSGTLVAQSDEPLGQRPADSGWMEQVAFDALPAGTYDIYTGWYHYPDNVRFAVRSDLPEAVNSWVHLGQVRLD